MIHFFNNFRNISLNVKKLNERKKEKVNLCFGIVLVQAEAKDLSHDQNEIFSYMNELASTQPLQMRLPNPISR